MRLPRDQHRAGSTGAGVRRDQQRHRAIAAPVGSRRDGDPRGLADGCPGATGRGGYRHGQRLATRLRGLLPRGERVQARGGLFQLGALVVDDDDARAWSCERIRGDAVVDLRFALAARRRDGDQVDLRTRRPGALTIDADVKASRPARAFDDGHRPAHRNCTSCIGGSRHVGRGRRTATCQQAGEERQETDSPKESCHDRIETSKDSLRTKREDCARAISGSIYVSVPEIDEHASPSTFPQKLFSLLSMEVRVYQRPWKGKTLYRW